jgi:hypothetical protein
VKKAGSRAGRNVIRRADNEKVVRTAKQTAEQTAEQTPEQTARHALLGCGGSPV